MHIGRIVGDNVTDIRFRARYGTVVNVGEMLVAQDEERGYPFLLRVYDVGYGAEAAGEDSVERTAGGMLLLDDRNEEVRLAEKERRLYLDVRCMPLGYVKDGDLKRAKTIPSHFSIVRRAKEDDYGVLTRYMGGVEVGMLRSGEDVLPIPVGIDGELAFPFHIGVFATTGMGKSNLMKCLSASVMREKRCGLLILDPHGEYYDGGGKKELKGLRDF
ncbi:MAG: DUF87 domain-containing protein, partial [Thermoplasmata archaeon]|nr:DUF87 domain-containing protein [Thermoplasmata archaeon]